MLLLSLLELLGFLALLAYNSMLAPAQQCVAEARHRCLLLSLKYQGLCTVECTTFFLAEPSVN